jgi:hypothetical protein
VKPDSEREEDFSITHEDQKQQEIMLCQKNGAKREGGRGEWVEIRPVHAWSCKSLQIL